MKHKTVLDNIPFGVMTLNKRGEIQFINFESENLLGISKKEIRGKRWEQLNIKTIKHDYTLCSNEENPFIISSNTSNAKQIDIIGIFNSSIYKYIWLKVSASSFIVHNRFSGDKEYLNIHLIDISEEFSKKSTYAEIIDNANLGTWEWNIQTGETFFNENWAKILGYSLQELSPTSIDTWIKLGHPTDLEVSNKNLALIFEKKTTEYKCVVRMKHKSGHWVWVYDSGKVTQWTEDGKPLIMSGIHQDITDQKNAELKLKKQLQLEKNLALISATFIQSSHIDDAIIKSFEILASINNASRVYLFQFDESIVTMSNTHEWCNKGISPEINNLQCLPANIFPWWMKKLYNNEIIDVPNISEMPNDATAEKDILESQHIKSVLVVPLYVKNKLKGFIGFANVISCESWLYEDQELLRILADILSNAIERKEAEKNIALLRKATEESPVSLLVTNKKGIIEYANKGFLKISGYQLHEIIGKTPSFLKSNKHENSFYEDLWHVILSGRTWRGVFCNKTKNGDFYWDDKVISPIIQNGHITHFVSISQDISEKKKLYNDLVIAKEKAEESDRLKSAFLATMNHELRTPLNHIIGYSNLIPDMVEDENTIKFAKVIHKSGIDLLHIIEDIFDLAVIEKSTMHIRDNMVYLREIYLTLKNQLQNLLFEANKSNSINLTYKIDNSIVSKKIITDKTKLIQVVTNLLKNAVKFTQKGEISLKFNIEANTKQLCISVEDSGIGIAKNDLPILFDFFRQVDDSNTREYGGIGIGLAISQKIAQAMGGIISVESKIGIGSIFTFKVPIQMISEDLQTYTETEKVVFLEDYRKKTILIVEDDIISMDMIVAILEPSGCKIIKATNGKQAIDLLNNENKINLILMDLKMSVMDGYTATSIIRKSNQSIPIIALTAYSLIKDKTKAIAAGCNDIITKPVDQAILLNTLITYL
jgi:PAS domain S-box-containing protein